MELKEAIERHKAECNRFGIGEYLCPCQSCKAFAVVLSAAEKAEEYREKAEKWDASMWWAELEDDEKIEWVERILSINKTLDGFVLDAYRKAQEGK